MSDETLLLELDFDSTLFDIPSFLRALPLAAQAAFGIDPAVFTREIKTYYVRDERGGLIGYDPDAHFAHHHVDLTGTDNHSRLVKALYQVHKELTGEDDFLYPDARRLLVRLKASKTTKGEITTVNTNSVWDLKRLLCGDYLEGIAARVVHTPNKGPVFAREWRHGIVSGGQTFPYALVVDDSPTQIEAAPDRPEIRRVQIVRHGQRYPANESGIPTIPSLDKLTV